MVLAGNGNQGVNTHTHAPIHTHSTAWEHSLSWQTAHASNRAASLFPSEQLYRERQYEKDIQTTITAEVQAVTQLADAW